MSHPARVSPADLPVALTVDSWDNGPRIPGFRRRELVVVRREPVVIRPEPVVVTTVGGAAR